MASSRIYSECGGVSCVRECLIHVAEIIAHDCDLCLFVVCWRVVMLGWAGAMFFGVCVCVGMTLATATWGFSATLRYAPPT